MERITNDWYFGILVCYSTYIIWLAQVSLLHRENWNDRIHAVLCHRIHCYRTTIKVIAARMKTKYPICMVIHNNTVWDFTCCEISLYWWRAEPIELVCVPLATAKQESDVSCICPIYLSVTSCMTAAKGCCRARAQITCIAYNGLLCHHMKCEDIHYSPSQM